MMCGNPCLRTDGADSFLHHVHLVSPYGIPGGNDLPVQVGYAYPVIINQVNRADSAPYQRLHRITAHSSNAKNRHMGLRQPF